MKKIQLSLIVSLMFVLPFSAYADLMDGIRTTGENGGLTGSGVWDGITNSNGNGPTDNGASLSWKIIESEDGYLYNYTFTGASGELGQALSNLILQVTNGAGIDEFLQVDEDGNKTEGEVEGEINTYNLKDFGNSTTGMPEDVDLYGIKWNTSDDPTSWDLAFWTLRVPVWGDFYAKGGQNYVYNNGFGDDPSGENYINFISRPNGSGPDPDPVPEPATMLLFGTGLIGLAGVARRRNKK